MLNGAVVSGGNSTSTRHSKVYLRGDSHCTHAIHDGILFTFANNPPKIINGIVKTGVINTAVSILEKLQDTR